MVLGHYPRKADAKMPGRAITEPRDVKAVSRRIVVRPVRFVTKYGGLG